MKTTHQSKKRAKYLLILGTLVFTSIGSNSEADLVTYDAGPTVFNFENEFTHQLDNNQSSSLLMGEGFLNFQRFNPNLGELTGVSLDLYVDNAAQWGLTSGSGFPFQMSHSLGWNVFFNNDDGLITNDFASGTSINSNNIYRSPGDLGGLSPHTHSTPVVTYGFQPSEVFEQLGGIDFDARIRGFFTTQSSAAGSSVTGSILAGQSSFAGQIRYEFTPANVPEPSSAVLALALPFMALRRNRRTAC